MCWLIQQISAQTANVVQPDSAIYSIHRSSIGKVAFMGKVVPIEQFTENDFLTTFELTDNTDLNIRVFLGNSLTNYLHQLSPETPVEQLTKKGNFQFVFWVDDKKIYTENLHVGAFGEENKNRKTVFRVPLVSSIKEDSWGRFLWNRFRARGGEDALTEGSHLLKIDIKPYLQLETLLTGPVIAQGQIRLTIPTIKVDDRDVVVQAIQPLSDWLVSKDKTDVNILEELNRKIAAHKFKDITSIVVIKNGQLLIEEYFNGATRNTLHDTRSVGKSFASALLGLAIRDGYIKNEEQTLRSFYNMKEYDHYDVNKENITLKSLLTMTAPFDGSDMDDDSPGHEEKMYPEKNWVNFALGLPLDSGKVKMPRWDYFTAGVVILGDIIHKSVPGGLEKYASKNLFKPLGIKQFKWQYTPQKVANTAGSLQLRAIDLAKFGQLYQQQGKWENRQILPAAWVEKSLTKQAVISEDEAYSYLFWNKTYHESVRAYEAFYASGNGGNRIIIFKDQPIIIVITSTAFNTPYGHRQTDKIVEDYLLPAVLSH
ncbi:MAG: serine hydrolase [Saprospiraceae bacterium]|nr:serine hydrolase [Saprospiraceae bacterium]